MCKEQVFYNVSSDKSWDSSATAQSDESAVTRHRSPVDDLYMFYNAKLSSNHFEAQANSPIRLSPFQEQRTFHIRTDVYLLIGSSVCLHLENHWRLDAEDGQCSFIVSTFPPGF